MFLGGRAAWTFRAGRGRRAVFVILNWLWLPFAMRLNRDRHGVGPRNILLLIVIGWVPPLNTVLSGALLVLSRRRELPLAR